METPRWSFKHLVAGGLIVAVATLLFALIGMTSAPAAAHFTTDAAGPNAVDHHGTPGATMPPMMTRTPCPTHDPNATPPPWPTHQPWPTMPPRPTHVPLPIQGNNG